LLGCIKLGKKNGVGSKGVTDVVSDEADTFPSLHTRKSMMFMIGGDGQQKIIGPEPLV